jgi:asparagine synthase (glutamine-hydrolysing)
MCGICGYLNFNHKKYASVEIIRLMSNTLIHRGPDEYGEFNDRGLGLGFRRLRIVDSFSGQQPMQNEDGTIVIVFNGEIYNYQAIRAQLERKHVFKSKSDTEILVHLYEEKKYEMLEDLNGMFSFAIWDKENEILFCARDRAGQKPFYYSVFDGNFIFASEPKAILSFSPYLNAIDLNSLAKYFAFEYVPVPNTMFKQIKQLPAGHFMIINSSGNLKVNRYWNTVFNYGDSETKNNKNEICSNLFALFRESVRKCSITDVPKGVFLSGGVDSSSIVSIMKDFSNFTTFSVTFEEKTFDESEYVDEAVKYFGTSHKNFLVTPRKIASAIPELTKKLDEPFADPSVIVRYLLSKFAKQYVKVILSGDGGDELFAGYQTFQGQKLVHMIRFLPFNYLKPALNKIIKYISISNSNYSIDFVAKQFLKGLGHEPEIMNQIWIGPFDHTEINHLLNEDLNLCNTKEKIYEELLVSMGRSRIKMSNIIDRILYYYFTFYLQYDLAKVDRASMVNSLEVRSPFLDKKFLEFLSAVPPHYKLNRFSLKHILKIAMNDRLPEKIIKRSKRGFSVPIGLWLKTDLKKMLTDVLNTENIKAQGLFNSVYIENLIKEHFQGIKNNQKQLWALFMFSLWYANFQEVALPK